MFDNMANEKPTNPKDAIAVTRLPLHLVPDTVRVYASLAFLEGALKYGGYNWRKAGVRSSVYKSAMERHLIKWWNGEWADPRTKVPHLASILACAGIILDANVAGKLTDDRPPKAPVGPLVDDFAKMVEHLKEEFKDYNPHQYTIKDDEDEIQRT